MLVQGFDLNEAKPAGDNSKDISKEQRGYRITAINSGATPTLGRTPAIPFELGPRHIQQRPIIETEMRRNQPTIVYLEADAQKAHQTLCLLKRRKHLSMFAICPAAVVEKLEHLE